MPRRCKPIPQPVVLEFFSLIYDGELDAVSAKLLIQPRLAFTKDKCNNNITGLMVACMCPCAIPMLSLLLQYNAPLNARDDLRRNVLLYACEYGANPQTIDFLCQHPTAVAKKCFSWHHCTTEKLGVLALACRSQNLVLVRHLMHVVPLQSIRGGNGIDMQLTEVVKGANDGFAMGWLALNVIKRHFRSKSTLSDHFLYNIVATACDLGLFRFVNGLAILDSTLGGYVVTSYYRQKLTICRELYGVFIAFKNRLTWQGFRPAFLVLYKGDGIPTMPIEILRTICGFVYQFDIARETSKLTTWSQVDFYSDDEDECYISESDSDFDSPC